MKKARRRRWLLLEQLENRQLLAGHDHGDSSMDRMDHHFGSHQSGDEHHRSAFHQEVDAREKRSKHEKRSHSDSNQHQRSRKSHRDHRSDNRSKDGRKSHQVSSNSKRQNVDVVSSPLTSSPTDFRVGNSFSNVSQEANFPIAASSSIDGNQVDSVAPTQPLGLRFVVPALSSFSQPLLQVNAPSSPPNSEFLVDSVFVNESNEAQPFDDRGTNGSRTTESLPSDTASESNETFVSSQASDPQSLVEPPSLPIESPRGDFDTVAEPIVTALEQSPSEQGGKSRWRVQSPTLEQLQEFLRGLDHGSASHTNAGSPVEDSHEAATSRFRFLEPHSNRSSADRADDSPALSIPDRLRHEEQYYADFVEIDAQSESAFPTPVADAILSQDIFENVAFRSSNAFARVNDVSSADLRGRVLAVIADELDSDPSQQQSDSDPISSQRIAYAVAAIVSGSYAIVHYRKSSSRYGQVVQMR